MSPRASSSSGNDGGGSADEGAGLSCASSTLNGTFHCLTGGQCINATDVCNGVDDCDDASDESFTHAHCYDVYLSSTSSGLSVVEIVAIVVGCVVAVAVICCVLGTTVDCVLHIYRYWCPACVRKACCPRHSQRVTSRFPDPVLGGGAVDTPACASSPRLPVVLLLKQLPPNCSTIVVGCRPSPPGELGGQGDPACYGGDCGHSPSTRSSTAMLMTSRHGGRRRSGSGYSSSARCSPLSSYARRASGGLRAAAYFSPFLRPRTGSDETCETCVAASSFGSSSCSVAVDVPGPHTDAGRGASRRSWFRHIGVGDTAWLPVRRRDSVAVYDDRLSAASDTLRIMPSAPSLSRLPPSYSSICVTSWTQHQQHQQQQQQPQQTGVSPGSRCVPSPSLSVQTELKTVEWKSFEDI